MKKIIYLALIAVLLGFFSTGCEKEKIIKNSSNNCVTNNGKGGQDPGLIFVGCFDFMTDICTECNSYCEYPGEVCLPCVTVTPKSTNGILLGILEGLKEGDPTAVAKFFSDSSLYSSLFPRLDSRIGASFLQKLQTGEYTLKDIYKDEKSENRIFSFEEPKGGNTIALVYAEE